MIEQPTYWKTDRATSVAQTVVTSTPDLAGIYMQSDAVMLAGVLSVLKSAGRAEGGRRAGHLYLISIDGTPFALKKIREGWLDAAISQPLDLYVKYGLAYLQDAVAGKTFAQGPTDHDSRIDELNGNPMDLLPAPMVTKANVDDHDALGQPGQIAAMPASPASAGEPAAAHAEPDGAAAAAPPVAEAIGVSKRFGASQALERRLARRSRRATRGRWSGATAPASRRWSPC